MHYNGGKCSCARHSPALRAAAASSSFRRCSCPNITICMLHKQQQAQLSPLRSTTEAFGLGGPPPVVWTQQESGSEVWGCGRGGGGGGQRREEMSMRVRGGGGRSILSVGTCPLPAQQPRQSPAQQNTANGAMAATDQVKARTPSLNRRTLAPCNIQRLQRAVCVRKQRKSQLRWVQ